MWQPSLLFFFLFIVASLICLLLHRLFRIASLAPCISISSAFLRQSTRRSPIAPPCFHSCQLAASAVSLSDVTLRACPSSLQPQLAACHFSHPYDSCMGLVWLSLPVQPHLEQSPPAPLLFTHCVNPCINCNGKFSQHSNDLQLELASALAVQLMDPKP